MVLRSVLPLGFLLAALPAMAETTRTQTVKVGPLTRTYHLHVPDAMRRNRELPLVIVFHGSGADGTSMEKLTKFSLLADREGFLVAYPDAIQHEWNDGREAHRIPSQANHVDDVAFVDAMISHVGTVHRVDAKRIYATGFSNGGIFAHYLGSRLSNRLAAIAPVSGGLAEPVAKDFRPASPLSVCMIHGAADTVVPYHGGPVDQHDFGRIIATEQSVNLWAQQAGGSLAEPKTGVLPSTTANGHRRVTYTRYPAPKGSPEVVLYTIEDGGHGWPSDPKAQRLLSLWPSSHSFDTTLAIWEFFRNHPKA